MAYLTLDEEAEKLQKITKELNYEIDKMRAQQVAEKLIYGDILSYVTRDARNVNPRYPCLYSVGSGKLQRDFRSKTATC